MPIKSAEYRKAMRKVQTGGAADVIESLTRENALLKRTLKERDERIAESEAQLLTFTTYSAGGIEKLSKLVQQLTQERDGLLMLINGHELGAREVARLWMQHYHDERLEVDEQADDLPGIVQVIRYALHGANLNLEEVEKALVADMRADGINPGSTHPDAALFRIGSLHETTALFRVGVMLNLYAWGRANEPALVAGDILRRWESGKEIEPGKIIALCEKWPDAPARAGTIIEALTQTQKAQKLSQKFSNQDAIARKINIDGRIAKKIPGHCSGPAKTCPTGSHTPGLKSIRN